MESCVFCKISKKEIPAKITFEDDEVLVFADIKPSAPVHYLVVPKEHIQSIIHLQDNHQAVISKLIFTAKAAAEKLGLKGYKFVFNVGKEGGQEVDHLHLHLLGGWKSEGEVQKIEDAIGDRQI